MLKLKKRCGDHWCCCLGIISLAATPRKRQKTANENTTSIHKIWFKQMEKIVVLWYHLLFLNFIFKQFSKKWESILNTSSARKSSNISPKKRGQLIQTVSKQFANDRLFTIYQRIGKRVEVSIHRHCRSWSSKMVFDLSHFFKAKVTKHSLFDAQLSKIYYFK